MRKSRYPIRRKSIKRERKKETQEKSCCECQEVICNQEFVVERTSILVHHTRETKGGKNSGLRHVTQGGKKIIINHQNGRLTGAYNHR